MFLEDGTMPISLSCWSVRRSDVPFGVVDTIMIESSSTCFFFLLPYHHQSLCSQRKESPHIMHDIQQSNSLCGEDIFPIDAVIDHYLHLQRI